MLKKDLYPKIEIAKSTVADWIVEFNVYIPTVKEGNRVYYRPEAVDVLLFIKKCREQNYNKTQIFKLLAEEGFPITVEDAVNDLKESVEGSGNYRDNLLTIMQTTGQAVAELANQKERLDGQDERLETLSDQQDGQDERIKNIEQRTDEMDRLKKEIEILKQEIATTNDKNKKGFFARLFGK